MNIIKENYENTTMALLYTVDSLKFNSGIKNTKLKDLTVLLRNSFKMCETRELLFGAPNVKLWAGERKNIPVFSKSFCDSSSYIIFDNLYGEFDFMYISYTKWPIGGPHCYLRHKKSGIIFDITFDQYTLVGIDIPYNLGRTINPTSPEWNKERVFKLANYLNIPLLNYASYCRS